jgi:predicted transcriptional regulator
MARKKSQILTEGEERVMRVLWDKREVSVREVTDILSREQPTAYNTALTVLRVLTDKGYVEPRSDGRAYVYRALVSRTDAQRQVLKHFVGRFFGGSPTELALHLVRQGDVDFDELQSLRDELNQSKKVRKGRAGT